MKLILICSWGKGHESPPNPSRHKCTQEPTDEGKLHLPAARSQLMKANCNLQLQGATLKFEALWDRIEFGCDES